MLETSKMNSRAINTISKHLNKILLFLKVKKHPLQLSNKSNLKSLLHLLLKNIIRARELKSIILMKKRL
jgi:hypothetical protein